MPRFQRWLRRVMGAALLLNLLTMPINAALDNHVGFVGNAIGTFVAVSYLWQTRGRQA